MSISNATETETRTYQIGDTVAAQEQHETDLGCVGCGCAEPADGWQGRVSSPREGWLCGPCTKTRFERNAR